MTLDPNEVERQFSEVIRAKLEQALRSRKDGHPRQGDEIGLTKLLRWLIVHFLGLEFQAVIDLYYSVRHERLTESFAEYYTEDSVPEFTLMLVHFVIENDVNLFWGSLNPTGNYFGKVYIANLRQSWCHDELIIRIQQAFVLENWSEHYRVLYQAHKKSKTSARSRPEASSADTLGSDKSPDQVPKKGNLVGPILGTAILVAMGASALVRRIFITRDTSAQAIFPVAVQTGSVEVLGFCMEKAKRQPVVADSAITVWSTSLKRPELAEVIIRAETFLVFMNAFLNLRTPGLSRIAEKNSGLVWEIFQHIFWLITQPYEPSEAKFRLGRSALTHRRRRMRIRPFQSHEALEKLAKRQFRKDNDRVTVSWECIKLMRRLRIGVHTSNQVLFESICRSVKAHSDAAKRDRAKHLLPRARGKTAALPPTRRKPGANIPGAGFNKAAA